MKGVKVTLAEIDGFGKIYRCGNCENIHLQVGAMSIALSVDTYMQLVTLVNTSAANFEAAVAWRESDHYEQHG